MSDLLEIVLNCVLELVGEVFAECAGWRFCVPFVGSLALAGLLYWARPDNSLAPLPLVATGLVTGIAWEVVGRRRS